MSLYRLDEMSAPFTKSKSKKDKALEFAKKHKKVIGTGLFLASPIAIRGGRKGFTKLQQADQYMAANHPGVRQYGKDLGTAAAIGAAALPFYYGAKTYRKYRRLMKMNDLW
nr:hypothetical protein [Catenibacterium mitsuokai]